MKRIYAFTLKTDEEYTKEVNSNLKLIAYMLYETIRNFWDGGRSPLSMSKNVKYNMLLDKDDEYQYRFYSDVHDVGKTYYEPFLLSDYTFCFTVYDDVIDEDLIRYLLKNVLGLTRTDYEFDITSIDYFSEHEDDERYREKAIKEICNTLDIEYEKENNLIRKLLGCFSKKR